MPSADPLGADPDDRDNPEVELDRRGREAMISPWTVILLIFFLGTLVYVALAVLG